MKFLKVLFLLILSTPLVQFACAQSSNDSLLDTSILGNNEDVGKYLKTRGFKMYYETYGEGKPLLFIHGNGGSMRAFINQAPYFAQHYKIILPDSRAQGKSIDTGDSLSYEMMADDLNALLDSLHLDSCYVIGWSDGGIDGLLLAIRHPDKVKKLAISGANLWPDTSAVDPFNYFETLTQYNSLKKVNQTPEIKNELKLLRLMIFEPHITLNQLKSIHCPTLVIGGDHDVILPKHTMLIADAIPKSYLWIVPNSGHATLINYKDQFNKVVSEFSKKPYRKIEGNDRGN